MISIGVCNRCGCSITLPSFSLGPLSAQCPCLRDLTEDPVDVGHRFDKQVQRLHAELLSELSGASLQDLAERLEEDVRNLCGGIESKNKKTALAFLIRLGALARYAAVDCSELEGVTRDV